MNLFVIVPSLRATVIPSFLQPVCDLNRNSGQYLFGNSTFKNSGCYRTTARQTHRSHVSAGFRTVSAGLKTYFLSLFFPSVIIDEVSTGNNQPSYLNYLTKNNWRNIALVFSESAPSLQASQKHGTVHGSKI